MLCHRATSIFEPRSKRKKDMEFLALNEWVIIASVFFLASAVQSTLGFGFAMIAVTPCLLIINSVAAIQLIIIGNFVMALVAWPSLKGHAPKNVLFYLFIGSLVGIPAGAYIYHVVDITVIKVLVALVILLATGETAWRFSQNNKQADNQETEEQPICITQSRPAGYLAGFLSGALTSSLSTPGPATMLYLTRSHLSTTEIRASILIFYIFAYGCATFSQSAIVGISAETWKGSAILAPVIFLGVVVGHFLAKHINPVVFRWIVIVVLGVSGVYMLGTTLL